MTRWRGGRERTTPPSVYRALHALEACGLVCKIESLNAYLALAGSSRAAPPAFLICQACQSVTELDTPDLAPVRRVADQQGFQIGRWALEAVGLCQACRAAEADILPGHPSARWTRRR
jgi:Fur family zinc uptake transcriptional regulator